MLKLQEFIRENPDNWEDLLKHSPYNLTIKRSDKLVIFNYNQFVSDFGNPIVQESRGIILEEGSWEVVCMGFSKFFNYGEPHAASIDWKTARVQTKVDGSVIKIFYYDGQWRVATNGMINAFETPAVSAHPENNTIQTTFGELFVKCARNQGLDKEGLNKDYTYIFELTTPYNEQVIKYEKPAIWHIGTRNNKTLEELRVDINIQKPQEWSFQTLEDVIKTAQTFQTEQEGFVVVDGNWQRVKVKSPYYVAASHYFNDTLALSKLIAIFLSGDYDEFLAYYPKYTTLINKMKNFVIQQVEKIEKDSSFWSEKIKKIPDLSKKDFFLQIKNNENSAYLCKLYEYYTGIRSELPSPKQYVLRQVNISKQIKKYLRENGITEDTALL